METTELFSGIRINNLSEILENDLDDNSLIVVEDSSDNVNYSTKKLTLKNLSDWIKEQWGSLTLEDITIDNINITDISEANDELKLFFTIPEYEEGKSYFQGNIVRDGYKFYQSLINGVANLSDTTCWLYLGYKNSKYITINNNNEIELSSLASIIFQFNNEEIYKVNDIVESSDNLFICVQEGTGAGAKWKRLCKTYIEDFEANKSFLIGDIVFKDGKIYRCIEDHIPTTWISNKWEIVANSDIVTKLYIKFSDTDLTGQSIDISSTDYDIPNDYMGLYWGENETAPIYANSYKWYKIKGEADINLEADDLVILATLDKDNWTLNNDVYSLSIGVNDVDSSYQATMNLLTSDMYPIIDIVYSNVPTNWEDEIENYNKIYKATCGTRQLTFYCLEEPTEDIDIKIRISGVPGAGPYTEQSTTNALTNRVSALENQLAGINEFLESILSGDTNG